MSNYRASSPKGPSEFAEEGRGQLGTFSGVSKSSRQVWRVGSFKRTANELHPSRLVTKISDKRFTG